MKAHSNTNAQTDARMLHISYHSILVYESEHDLVKAICSRCSRAKHKHELMQHLTNREVIPAYYKGT